MNNKESHDLIMPHLVRSSSSYFPRQLVIRDLQIADLIGEEELSQANQTYLIMGGRNYGASASLLSPLAPLRSFSVLLMAMEPMQLSFKKDAD